MPGPRREYPLIANMAQRLTTDTTEISPNMGFIPSTTGTAVVRPSADASTVSIPVVAGVHVPIDILEFDKTSSTAGQEIVVIRQGCV